MGYRVTQSGGLVHLEDPVTNNTSTVSLWNLSSSVSKASSNVDRGYYNGDLGVYDITATLDTYGTGPVLPAGEALYTGSNTNTSAGAATTSSTWTAPTGVNSVSVVCIGGGGGGAWSNGTSGPSGGGGGGGALAWANDLPVTPGVGYAVVAGDGGYNRDNVTINASTRAAPGGNSSFTANSSIAITARGGTGGISNTTSTSAPTGGTRTYTNTGAYVTGGGNGGAGGPAFNNGSGSGGGGAGGYSGNGGQGQGNGAPVGVGVGGSGAGGFSTGTINNDAGNGGGVFPYGEGAPGTATNTARGGSGAPHPTTRGGSYGGGGAGMEDDTSAYGDRGGEGAVRIIWPGSSRKFPSTQTADGAGGGAAFAEGFNLGQGGFTLPIKTSLSIPGRNIYSGSNSLPGMPTRTATSSADYTGAYDIMATYVSFAANANYPVTGRLYIGYRTTTSPTFSGDIAIGHIAIYEGGSSPTLVKEWTFAGSTTVWQDGAEIGGTTTTTAVGLDPSTAGFTSINTGASVGNWTLASGTGSSSTGAADGISGNYTDPGTTDQTGAVSQVSGNNYAFVEQSGQGTGDLCWMRSDEFTLSDNGYITIVMQATSNVTFDVDNALYAYFG